MRGVKVRSHDEFKGVYWVSLEDGLERLATLSLAPGVQVYGEALIRWQGREYRLWDPYRSKLAAAILKGLGDMPIKPGGKVLYLGSASGTTASHVSDIAGEKGTVFCVEFAPRVMRELIDRVCAHRPNVFPILEDARFPERYRPVVGSVDVIYCDIAQPDQARILADNADLYLKDGGSALVALKSRSIDVTMPPADVFEKEVDTLKARGFKIRERMRLEPYDKDHEMVSATR